MEWNWDLVQMCPVCDMKLNTDPAYSFMSAWPDFKTGEKANDDGS